MLRTTARAHFAILLVASPALLVSTACSEERCDSYTIVGDREISVTECPDGSSYQLTCTRVGENTNTHGWSGPYTCACLRDGVQGRTLDTSPFPWRDDAYSAPEVLPSVNRACGWNVPIPDGP
jgi:hypothetical protein